MIKRNKYFENNKNIIEIQYEPYLCNIKVINCSVELDENARVNLIIKKNKSKSLYIWAKDLVESINEDFNSTSFQIIFKGRYEDFEDLEDIVTNFNNEGWYIELKFIEISENKNILQKFEHFLDQIENSNIEKIKEAFKDNNVRNIYENTKNLTAEVGIIATMSSGKSTLINAMLGKDILPSRNEACTAKIFKLENDKTLSEYLYRVEEKNGESLLEWKKVDDGELDKLNNEEKGINVRIRGNFPGIDDNEMKMVFIDTPGPNSARNLEHKEVTFNFIKDNMKNPLVLYVLNATQLATNDDATLLKRIAESMRKNGKQAEERFIFALNKIDNLDPEEESLEEMLEKTRNYLGEFGIKNPKIFPVSASVAKLCRKKFVEELTLEEEEEYRDYIFKFFPDHSYEGIKTFEYSSLPERLKNEILEKINKSNIEKNENERLLHYSGITAIELYINRYVTKYIKSLKVKTAVETAKQTIDFTYSELNLLRGKTENELNKLSNEIEETKDKLKGKEKERIENLKDKINSLGIYEKEFIELVEKMGELFTEIEEDLNEEEISIKKAEAICKYVNKEIETILTDLKTSVINISIKQLYDKVKEIINILKAFYTDEFNNIPDAEDLKALLEQQLVLNLPDVEEMINYGYYTKKEKRWRTETRATGVEKRRKFWNPFTWFWPDEETIYEEVSVPEYITEQYVNLREIRDFFINGIKLKLRRKLEEVENKLSSTLENIKDEALICINRLEKQVEENLNKIGDKVKQQKNLSGNYEEIEKEFKRISYIKEEIEKLLEDN